MLSEQFMTSIRAQPRTANTAIAKDVGIYLHTLHPSPKIDSNFKKSSTSVNALAANSTHIFAAQADKAVVHVYSRERGNQEALISFPERLHSLTLVADGLLVLGTAEGRVILWEVSTGRQVSTSAAHLQPVSCIAATSIHLLTGSDDSNINVWSIPQLLSFHANTDGPHEPIRSLSNHRAAITSLVMGHGASTSNICISASRDNSIIVWNYHTGDLLRTFLLSATPLCMALDPCDRAVYAGLEDGSLQMMELTHATSAINPLYDAHLQNTPVQVTLPAWSPPSEIGAVHCLGLSYDGTSLFSGHATGKISHWDTGRRAFLVELADLNAPVTNLVMQSPFPKTPRTKSINVVKPRMAEGNYTFTAQLNGTKGSSTFEKALEYQGFPDGMLERALLDLAGHVPTATATTTSSSASSSSSEEEKLRKENVELWKVINEQRALQKKTFEKYSQLKTDSV
ncbi:hypothetical protein DSL72_001855 [Monilinia vaccinii-corymbosi]|uniref:Pre-rRNA-processing protein IPI3 n=1 Tax=Monilinia vaccinii-corymbosi TaxID=61207 RepID=A0A8A3PAZ9_9HELO|nr:hypothetical protein DSL72_001855 [Monilinia vaccinii-corymbosi]